MDRDNWTTLKILCLFLASAPQTGKLEHKGWLQHAVQWQPLQLMSLFMQCSHCCVYVYSVKLDGAHSGGLMTLRYYPHTIFSAPLLQLFFHIPRRVAGDSRNAGSALSSWHFLYYCLCYKIRCWELTNSDCQECFIQYLDVPGWLKSYWDVWIKGLPPSLHHQEIKAFNFSQSMWDFYFIWTDGCFCGLVSERKQCSRP